MRDSVLMMMRRIVEESSTMRIFKGISFVRSYLLLIQGGGGFDVLQQCRHVIGIDVQELDPELEL